MSVTELDTRRAVTIGGSSAAAACGVDPYRSRIMLWAELTGRIEREESEAMRWGRVLQAPIIEELRLDGWDIHENTLEVRDESRPWLTGHPDGYAYIAGEHGLLEIKTAGSWAGREWRDDVPIQYAAQVQHYLHLTGLDRALLACLVGGQRLVTRTLERDDAAIALLLELEEDFLGFVRADMPPPPDGSQSSAEALAALYPGHATETPGHYIGRVRLTREQMDWLRELKARKAQLAAVKEQASELENRLKAVMGNAAEAVGPSDDVVLCWTPTKRRALDTKLLQSERPELAELFMTETKARRFTVV